MKSHDERELAREIQALAGRIAVPAGDLPRTGRTFGGVMSLAGVVALVITVVAVGGAISGLRAERDNAGAATTATPTMASPSPSPTARVAFPDYALLAGTGDGFVYRIEAGQVRGSAVDACHGRSVLALRTSASARSVLVICGGIGGRTEGQALVLDTATMGQRGGPVTVTPRFDVGAWAPDERSIALLQQGACEAQAPVCSVHVLLWDLASGATRVIRPDQPLVGNVQWTPLGLSVSVPEASRMATVIWDGQAWNPYSSHALRIADAGGRALLVEAGTGNWGGRVWWATRANEAPLTTSGTAYPVGLDGDHTIVWRDEPAPNGTMVVYRGLQQESVVPAEGYCGQAQQIERWLICIAAGSSALAYSLDSNAFATEAISGLAGYNVLVALPR